MFFRKAKLIIELYAEIQRLREMLARTLGERDAFKEMAGKAIELAKEKHFPQEQSDKVGPYSLNLMDYVVPDYVSPEVKHCLRCAVSVRSDKWPVLCPNCGASVDAVLDADLISDPNEP